jgi:hypothetical protein
MESTRLFFAHTSLTGVKAVAVGLIAASAVMLSFKAIQNANQAASAMGTK